MRPNPLRLPLHPILFAIYPVLALLAHNPDQVPPSDALRPLIVSLLLAAIIYGLYFLVYRRPSSAALATSLSLLVFLSYGHIYNGLKLAGLPGDTLVRHRYLVPALVLVLIACLVLIARREPSAQTTTTLNVVALAALAFPIVSLLIAWRQAARPSTALASEPTECTLHPPPGATLPDIYVIIMDAYERDDVLRRLHASDITPFLETLESKGFYIVRGGMSNYRHTELSLASLLNMDYIQSFPEKYDPDTNGRWQIVQMIPHNRLRRELECIGYTTVATDTGIFWTEWSDADYFLAQDSDPLHSLGLLGEASLFEGKFLDTTIARVPMDVFRSSRSSAPPSAIDPASGLRRRILFAFDQLEQIPSLPSPKLVFVHILSPHPPMIFGPNGEAISRAEFETTYGPATEDWLLQAYADQVTFLNRKLEEAVTAILDTSTVSPVIVIQGDHGWADRKPEDKLSIFNAIHLPAGGNDRLYPTLTPVNTFRIVLDEYFGGRYDLLDDASYFSPGDAIYHFTEIPNTWPLPSP